MAGSDYTVRDLALEVQRLVKLMARMARNCWKPCASRCSA